MKGKLFFFEKLSSLLNAGLDVRKSLGIISSQEKGKNGLLADSISSDIARGKTLAGALEGYKRHFSDFEIALIRSGEITGNLSENLELLTSHLRRTLAWRRKFVSGLIYPVMLLHLAILLPPVKYLVMDGALLYLKSVYKPLVILYLSVLSAWSAVKVVRLFPAISSVAERIVWKVPFLGRIARNLAVSRFLTSLALALKAGMAADKSLRVSMDSSPGAVKAMLGRTSPELLRGEGITGLIRRSRILPEPYAGIIQSGETGGNLEDSLLYVSRDLESQAETISERAAIILPVIIYLGAVVYVASIIISFYAGIYGSVLKF